ncbi:cytochrome P450 4C1-like isoform X1 [Anthonomus grandis grandis]|uniref:cytochrome P450 4C1-like isoform X1 n=1 Tax=Anthonomus grandis grandis TaxID=2921223 RepID=UPI0021662AFA|nr:cytochrome P450 4C1-like isoform X1 [Anthonomus grandis grandis]
MIFSDLSLVLVILLVLLIFWVSHSRDKRLVIFSKLQSGPTPLPYIGNVNVLYKQNLIEGLLALKKQFSFPCNFWVYNDYYYITDNPEEIKSFLLNTTKSFRKTPFYDDLIKVMMKDSFVLLDNVEEWRHHRKLANKAFASSIWYKYTPVFHKTAIKLNKKLQDIKESVTLLEVLSRYSFDTFMENFMGVNIKDESTENELVKALTRMLNITFQRTLFNRTIPHWAYKYLTIEGRQFYKEFTFIKKRLKFLIDKKRIELQQKSENADYLLQLPLVETLILKEESDFSLDEVVNMMMLLYVTSIDTTVLTLFYTLMHLGTHAEIQDKVLQEILDNVGSEGEIETKDLSNLKYLEQCIFETLRLYPIVPVTGRHLTDDMIVGKKHFPKGANILISPFLVHRNEAYWKDPETFDPSRFSAQKEMELGSYLPFLVGPRDCPGRYYAVAQVKIMVANILRQYKIKVDPKVLKTIKFNYYIIIKPKIKFDIEFLPRI